MPKCPICKKMIHGSDRKKVNGVWMHHHSPIKGKEPIFREIKRIRMLRPVVEPEYKVSTSIYKKGDRRKHKSSLGRKK